MTEILAPVGNHTMLATAIKAKADAVYFGIKGINMRAAAKNFEIGELSKVVSKCHDNNVKAYLTVNTIVYDDEIEKIRKILVAAKDAKIDAIICWDMAVINLCNSLGLAINVSTQASVSNFEAVKQFYELGARAVVLARELSLDQIKTIIDLVKKEKMDIKIECFIHGAMCVAISGRCFMSQFTFGKSANRGECLQPCRREYEVTDTDRQYGLKLGSKYVMSPKDLCTAEIFDKLVDAGIDIFKIEGRGRNPEYVKCTVEVYKKLLKEYTDTKAISEESKKEAVANLKKVYNKELHTGFYLGTPTSNDYAQMYGSASLTKKDYIGIVTNFFKKINVAELLVETKELAIGDKVMIQGPTTGCIEFTIEELQIEHNNVKKAIKGQQVAVKINDIVRPKDKLFKIY